MQRQIHEENKEDGYDCSFHSIDCQSSIIICNAKARFLENCAGLELFFAKKQHLICRVHSSPAVTYIYIYTYIHQLLTYCQISISEIFHATLCNSNVDACVFVMVPACTMINATAEAAIKVYLFLIHTHIMACPWRLQQQRIIYAKLYNWIMESRMHWDNMLSPDSLNHSVDHRDAVCLRWSPFTIVKFDESNAHMISSSWQKWPALMYPSLQHLFHLSQKLW